MTEILRVGLIIILSGLVDRDRRTGNIGDTWHSSSESTSNAEVGLPEMSKVVLDVPCPFLLSVMCQLTSSQNALLEYLHIINLQEREHAVLRSFHPSTYQR